jgi:hypothetical protein
MTNLSSAAQAVLEGFRAVPTLMDGPSIAGALRAAADQVVPEEPRLTGMRPCGDTYSAREIRRGERMKLREQLLAIAAELEGKQ